MRLAERLWPVAALAGAGLVALGGRLVWEVPASPAPLSLQTLAVLVVGFAAGPLVGTGAMALYLAAAALGLPVLANGAGGIDALMGPTGGYLIGFLVAPGVAWGLAQGLSALPRALAVSAGGVVAHALILACGAGWLALRHGLDSQRAVDLGILPFVWMGLAKSVALGVLVAVAERLTGERRR